MVITVLFVVSLRTYILCACVHAHIRYNKSFHCISHAISMWCKVQHGNFPNCLCTVYRANTIPIEVCGVYTIMHKSPGLLSFGKKLTRWLSMSARLDAQNIIVTQCNKIILN